MVVIIIAKLLGLLTIISQILLFAFIARWLLGRFGLRITRLDDLCNWLAERTSVAFLIVSIATGGSLFFEHIAFYIPCQLCWWQRIFMYPQVILFGHDILRKKKIAFKYALMLSSIGLLISGYHYGLQMFAMTTPGFSDACSATGVSCASTEILEFGYITIPLMAFTAFALIIALSLFSRRRSTP